MRTFKEHPTTSGVGGKIINMQNSVFGVADDFLGSFSEHIHCKKGQKMKTIPTLNAAYRKADIKNLSFPNTNWSEDVIFNYRLREAGKNIIFNPEVIVYHNHKRMDLESFITKQKILGKGFVFSRSQCPNLSGQFLAKHRFLFLLLPRFFLILFRFIISKYFFKFLKVSPLILLGEIIRTKEILKI